MTQSSTRLKPKIGKWRQRLEPLLAALLLLRPFHCLRLLTFRHCCPPSHESWRVSHQCGRESTRTAFHLLQHNEKSSVPLNEVCIDARERRASSQATTTLREARALIRARSARHRASRPALQKISIKPGFLARIDNVHRDETRMQMSARAQIFSFDLLCRRCDTPQKKFAQGGEKTGRRRSEREKTANRRQVIRAARRYRLPRFTAAASGDWHRVRNFCRARRCARAASALTRRACA